MIKLLLLVAAIVLILRYVKRPGGPDDRIDSGKGGGTDGLTGVEDAVWEDVG